MDQKLKVIPLIDALRLMEAVGPDGNPATFRLRGVKYNRHTGQGGSEYDYANASLPRAGSANSKKVSTTPNSGVKKANHFKNGTRNLQVDGHTKKISIWLITHINDIRVIHF